MEERNHSWESTPSEAAVIKHEVYARIGLLGNPSDVYFGRTISLSLSNFSATVRLEPAEKLIIEPHPTHDLMTIEKPVSVRQLKNLRKV
ncbi:unnamed protein product [Rhodiola kirilowii]